MSITHCTCDYYSVINTRVLLHMMWLTYHSRAWVRDLSLEWDPLVVGPLFVSKGPQEGPPDVIHRVKTHGRAFEYTAAGTWRDRLETTTHTQTHTHTQSKCVDSDLDVEKMVYTRGFFLSLVCSRNTSPADGHTHTYTHTQVRSKGRDKDKQPVDMSNCF